MREEETRSLVSSIKDGLYEQLSSAIDQEFDLGQEGARSLVMLEVELGLYDPQEVDIEEIVRDYAFRGQSLKKILRAVNGATRGIPQRRSKTGYRYS